MSDSGLTRRTLLERAALAGVGALLAQLPPHMVAEARAQDPNLTVDTFNGLAAFALPGNDEYSVAQGESVGKPGAIAAKAVPAAIATFDRYFSMPGVQADPGLQASGAVALLLNRYAEQVNPSASRGGFPSHFSRLSFEEKAEVFRLWEQDPQWDNSPIRFASGATAGLMAFLGFTEVGVVDFETRRLTERPLGWEISGYHGVADGRPEHRGYWRGHLEAVKSERTKRWERSEQRRWARLRRRRRRRRRERRRDRARARRERRSG